MSEYRVASRYAKSLIELAQERGVLEEVKEDVSLFKQTVEENKDLELMLKSPVISHLSKAEVLRKIFSGKVNELTSMYFDIICKKNREAILFSSSRAFIDLYNVVKGVQTAKVVSAAPLTGTARTKISEVVASISGKTVELTEEVDPKLVGGYVLTIGDRQIDDSVKGRLEAIKEELL